MLKLVRLIDDLECLFVRTKQAAAVAAVNLHLRTERLHHYLDFIRRRRLLPYKLMHLLPLYAEVVTNG